MSYPATYRALRARGVSFFYLGSGRQAKRQAVTRDGETFTWEAGPRRSTVDALREIAQYLDAHDRRVRDRAEAALLPGRPA